MIDVKVIKADKAGFDYIIHTASPDAFSVNDVKKDLINPAIHGYALTPSSITTLLIWVR
jgi:hypothetical protein